MYSYIIDWLGITDLPISDDLKVLVTSFAAYFILSFLLDVFKMLYYTITQR